MTRHLTIGSACLAAALSGTAPVEAACVPVSGKFTEHILPAGSAPNDPAGRVIGNVDGTLKGATTAFITSIAPELNGNLRVTTNNVFVTDEGNQLFTRGDAHWEFIANGFYQVELTLQIVGGAGKYAGASGTIKTLGVGDKVKPGSGMFIQEYRGRLCTP